MEIPKTKQLIIQVAIDMFSDKGFSNVSMRDLAKEVGITPASIYNHFSSKDEIMSEIMESCHLKSLKPLAYSSEEDMYKLIENKTFDELIASLYKPFTSDEAKQIRKMFKILTVEQYTHPKAIEFWSKLAITETVIRWKKTLDIMVSDARLPEMNTLLAAELLTRIVLTYLIQCAHFQHNEDSETSLSMYTTYLWIFEKIKNGEIK